MDPQLSNEERSMRDKILQQEFPFDQEAWEAMQRLLDDERNPIPLILPPPTPPTGGLPGPASGRWWWLLLLLAFGAGFAALCWQQFNSAVLSTNKISRKNSNTADSSLYLIENEREENPTALTERPLAPGSFETTRYSTLKNLENTTTTAASQKKRKSELAQNKALHRVHTPVNTNPTNSSPPPVSPQTAKTRLNTDEPLVVVSPAMSGVPSAAAAPGQIGISPSESITTSRPSMQVDLLATLPLNPLTHASSHSDSLIRPVPIQPKPSSSWERAWIFGANLNAVNYQPLRFSALPHLGYMWRYRLNPRTALQGEFVLKYVSGYNWRAEFYDVVPGGSAQVILDNKRLLYFELPLVLQRQYAPGKSWLLGIKPAATLPIAPYGSIALLNSGAPQRNYSTHEGIRYVDLGLVLGWEYRFARRWALDIRYDQGLLDLTIDNFYQSNATHLNSDLQLSLRYFLRTKKQVKK